MTLQAQGRTHFGTAVDRMDRVSSVFGKPGHSSLPFDSFSLITLSHTLISLGCRPGHSRFLRPISLPPSEAASVYLPNEKNDGGWRILTWFPLTLTSRVAGPAVTSGPDLWFSQGVLEPGLGWSCGPWRPPTPVPQPGGVGREDTH